MLGRRTTLKDILIIHLHPENGASYHQRWSLIERSPSPVSAFAEEKKNHDQRIIITSKNSAPKTITEHSPHQPAT